MTEDMEKVAIELASFAMNEFTKEVEMAAHIKKEFDKMYRCGLTVSARPVRCVLISAPSMAPPHTLGGTLCFTETYVSRMTLSCPSRFPRALAKSYRVPSRTLNRSPTWHVVVGTNFGSHVVHQTKNFVYFNIGAINFLVYKSG